MGVWIWFRLFDPDSYGGNLSKSSDYRSADSQPYLIPHQGEARNTNHHDHQADDVDAMHFSASPCIIGNSDQHGREPEKDGEQKV
jgi:hypothetical protein